MLYGVQRRERCGIVATCGREHLTAGLAEHDFAAERIAVEQPADDPSPPRSSGLPTARQAPGSTERDLTQDRGRHELVHEPESEHLGGALDLAGEDDVQCRPRADQAGEALAAAGGGQDPELHLGEAQLGLGVIGGDAVGARQRELESSAQARAMDRGDDRLREARDALEHVLATCGEALRLGGALERDKLLDIGAGDEDVGFTGHEDDRLHFRVAREHLERREEFVLDRLRDLVDGFPGQVECDHRNAVDVVPGEGGTGGHQRRSSTIANAIPP